MFAAAAGETEGRVAHIFDLIAFFFTAIEPFSLVLSAAARLREAAFTCRRLPLRRLEALPVHDGRSALLVLRLGDPHRREGRERRKDRSTDPHAVLTLWGSHNLDLHAARCELRDFLKVMIT